MLRPRGTSSWDRRDGHIICLFGNPIPRVHPQELPSWLVEIALSETVKLPGVAGSSVSQLPTGTVTFLFTDIQGSTLLLRRLGERYATLLADHHRLLRGAFQEQGGMEVETLGDGLFFVFPTAKAALLAAISAQRAVFGHAWPDGASVRVRMGLHTGEALSGETGYVGIDVHRAARISAAGHGGQILLSQTARDLVREDLPEGVRLLDLGEHRLKDLANPRRLFQVVSDTLPSDFPPLKSLNALPNNLPRQLTSFVGRQHELREITTMVREAALLTLTGPGGVGKTRLAIQAAAELLETFEDGLWLVELAILTDPGLVVQTVAATLGVGEQAGRPLLGTIVDYLRSRRVLLLLDNCEHLLAPCAHVADTLLRGCPSLRILATSREALGIGGEALYPVPSLSLPDAGRALPVEQLGQYEAVRLFTVRARAVLPSFTLNERNAQAVAQISQRLDGIPLAVELAAARVKSLPVEQIAARLDDRFRLLTGGSRTALPRHQTLRAAMEWSYDLLGADERAVLRRTSVFGGGFTLDAAETVCASPDVPERDVLDLVTRLVDKSLVVAEGRDKEGRYLLLDTVREYGLSQLLESGEANATRRRHRDWCLALAEQARPEFFRGPEPKAWLERLDLEHDNLRAALAWSDADPEGGDAGLKIAAGLWRFWEIRGYLVEGRRWLERMLTRSTGSISELRANALTGAGVLAYIQGDYRAAFAFHEESLLLHRRLGDPHAIAYAANNLANAAVQQKDYARARSLYEEMLSLGRESGDWRGMAFGLINLADVAAHQEEYAEAQSLYEKSLAIFNQIDDRWGAAYALDNFGLMTCRRFDYSTAASLYARALAISRDLGDRRAIARTLTHLADAVILQRDVARARSLYAESLEIRDALGDKPGIASALERLAWASTGGDPDRAARLLGAAQALRQAIGASLNPPAQEDYDRNLASLQRRLGEERFKAAWEQGRKMTAEDAVTYATADVRLG